MDELEAIDDEIFVLAHGDGRSPPPPAFLGLPGIETAAEDADDDGFPLSMHIPEYKSRYLQIDCWPTRWWAASGSCDVNSYLVRGCVFAGGGAFRWHVVCW
jgi:hypothetical protein